MTEFARRLPDGLAIVKAKEDDIPVIKQMVNSAYSKYVERIGRPPAPMNSDWNALMGTRDVWVLRTTDSDDKAIGAVVLGADADADSIKINNLVVDPAAQGRGYGKILMAYAEDTARAKGRTALTLFTNVMMYENLVLYPKLGFYETERRNEAGYDRVYYRKDLV